MLKPTRREFLADSMLAAAAAAAGVAGSSRVVRAAKSSRSTSPNEKLGVAVIGARDRGSVHVDFYKSRDDVEILWIVDADSNIGEAKVAALGKKKRRKPNFAQDLRKALEDPAVDVVSIATPNHWHALASIWAMQHGKDVYVEKPVSHNVSEGRRIVETARKHRRICQAGTQSRSRTGLQKAMKFLHDGKLGRVTLARGLCYKRRRDIGPRGEYDIPASVNYDLWLGPAPEAPVTRRQFHYDWHWQWDYGNGDLGNQGIHQMDVARWGLNVACLPNSVLSFGGRFGYEDAGETANTQVVYHDYGDKTLMFEVRGLESKPYKGHDNVGVVFEGTEGYMAVSRYEAEVFDKDGKRIEEISGGDDNQNFENFLSAVRTRRESDLTAPIEEGHVSSALCHLGNISYRLGEQVDGKQAKERLHSLKTTDDPIATFERAERHLEDNGVKLSKIRYQMGPLLAVDTKNETFVDNAAADRFLTREYRAPYVLPTAENV